MSEQTHQLVVGFFTCEPLPPQSVRGIAKPIAMYRVVAEAATRNRVELSDPANLSTLVGRDTELSILKDRWEQALEGMGQVVTLVGEAGLGKSRLIREIREYVAQEHEGQPLGIAELRCSPQHTQSGFYPAVNFFNRLLDLESISESEARLGCLIKNLQDLKIDVKAHVALFANLMNIPLGERFAQPELSPQRQKELTGEFLAEWFRAFSRRHPMLFILEDLHWIDPSTLEVLTKFVEKYERDRVLSVLTFRPEFSCPWRDFSHQTRIALNRLTRRHVRNLLRDNLSRLAISEALVDAVIARTEGVPLFIEEFAKILDEANLNATASVEDLLSNIPATLHDLLIARLERLDTDQEVVQLAATIGREFSFGLLSRVTDLSRAELEVELRNLVDAEIIFQHGELPDARFLFKHALIQDAAYHSLLKKRRQGFHGRIVDALQQETGFESPPELLAYHATEAGRNTEAVEFWVRAGEHAQVRFENVEAVNHFESGLRLLTSLPESADRDLLELRFQGSLGAARIQTCGYSANEVGEALERARDLAQQLDISDGLFHISWGIWALRLCRDEMALAIELANDLTALANQTGQDALRTEAWFTKSITHFYRGEFEESLAASLAGQAICDPEAAAQNALHTGQNVRVTLLCYEALSRHFLGFPDQAIRRLHEALRVADEIQHPFSSAYLAHHAGWLYYQSRFAEEAKEAGRDGQALCNEQGFPFFAALCTVSEGTGFMVEGRYDEALPLIELGKQQFLATGASMSLCHYLGNLGYLHHRLGRNDEAVKLLDQGIERLESTCNRFFEAELYRLKALALNDENHDQAMQWLDRSTNVARAQKAQAWELRTAITRVDLLTQTGTLDSMAWGDACEALRTVFSKFTEGRETPDLMDAQRRLDQTDASE